MANFNLTWTPNITANVTAQRAYYRQRSIGGSYITTGFSPANDISTSVTATAINGLSDNVVYQFQIANICTTGGPTFNNNGVQEGIKFSCIAPTATEAGTSVTGVVSSIPTDITKIRFSLYDSSVSTLLQGPIDVVVSGASASHVFTGLTNSTTYIIRTELIAVVNGTEVISSCGIASQVSITTSAPSACPAPTNLIVT